MDNPGTALILIDIQKDYFEGGAFPLDPGQVALAVRTGAALLDLARQGGRPVVHVRHEFDHGSFLRRGTPGSEIHHGVAPVEGEMVVTKESPNSFRGTTLERILRERGVSRLVVGGMIAWMCVQSTVRAAWELGFEVHLVPDLVASRGVSWNGVELDARQTLSAALHPLFWAFAREASVSDAARLLGNPDRGRSAES